MILAITGRLENVASEKPFDNRYYFTTLFKEIFDELDILLFPILTERNIHSISDLCDGLIIPGSYTDINPKYYGEEPMDGKIYDIDEFRLDRMAIEAFTSKTKPILGICGGLQSINVHFGGNLYQDIDNHKSTVLTHRIKIEENSFLYATYGTSELEVNSLHRQSVKTPAPGFKVIATSEDGIVEAIQRDNIIGVQWHPEVLGDLEFFKSFIRIYLSK